MITEEQVTDSLKSVIDPELGVNIVDLGLVYGIQVQGPQVDVKMTLTTPACPAGPEIIHNATTAVEGLEGVEKANVRLVMDPPWTPERMSEDAKDDLGIF